MRLTRVFVDAALAPDTTVTLPETAAGHLLRVLRLGLGDACVLFNGDGRDYDARIAGAGKRDASVEVLSARELANESPLRIVLLQALARGEKMDWIVQKATELGVAGLVPVASERGEVKLDGERADKRTAHWRSVAIAACEQSGRARVPDIAAPQPLAKALSALPPQARRLTLDPEADTSIATLQLGAQEEVVVAIGPEGGWSAGDLALLRGAGFAGLRLGPRVLRTETAGLAAIAALQARFGDFA
ncbi:MAG TPA: 16S rRNA (uracil(1498)-N(3))-methyltransferase [Xanthomonadaceae bacterium]|nr:16S rRNA (uracil(1498)-N(3))-methyltransferase [Xanthomonadaceae bacterium]